MAFSKKEMLVNNINHFPHLLSEKLLASSNFPSPSNLSLHSHDMYIAQFKFAIHSVLLDLVT